MNMEVEAKEKSEEGRRKKKGKKRKNRENVSVRGRVVKKKASKTTLGYGNNLDLLCFYGVVGFFYLRELGDFFF